MSVKISFEITRGQVPYLLRMLRLAEYNGNPVAEELLWGDHYNLGELFQSELEEVDRELGD